MMDSLIPFLTNSDGDGDVLWYYAGEADDAEDALGAERSLLVMCTAFRGKAEAYPNLTIKKIPKTVLSRCEWGHDDYSLEVANLAPAPPPSGQQGLGFED